MNTAMGSEVIIKAVPSFCDVSDADFRFMVQAGTLLQGMTAACKEAVKNCALRSMTLRCVQSSEGSITVEFMEEHNVNSPFELLPF